MTPPDAEPLRILVSGTREGWDEDVLRDELLALHMELGADRGVCRCSAPATAGGG